VALAAIADDGDFLALDEVNVGIPVIVNAHGRGVPWSILAWVKVGCPVFHFDDGVTARQVDIYGMADG
jgi:hypothetical protein